MRSRGSVRLCVVLATVAFVAGVGLATFTREAQARRGRRGPSPQQIAAMKKQMQEQAEMQQNLYKAQQRKDQQVIAQFDLNGNGRIDGPTEKGPYDKFWREVELGKKPHPYSFITANELKPASTSKTAPKKK